MRNHDDVLKDYGVHGLCVTAAEGWSLDTLAVALRSQNRQYGRARQGELMEVGWVAVPEPERDVSSALLICERRPTLTDLDTLRAVFQRRPMRDNDNYAGPRER